MGKATSLIESQHHHLLHCLEKTTVSPSPSPPPRSALALAPFRWSGSHSESSAHTFTLGPDSEVKVCPVQIQKVVTRSLSTLGGRTSVGRPALSRSSIEEAVPLSLSTPPTLVPISW